MKARLKGTDEWLEVTALFYADGEHYGFRLGDDKEHFYYADALEFEREPDWEAYRREVAKDVLCALRVSGFGDEIGVMVNLSIQFADELIKQLKEK